MACMRGEDTNEAEASIQLVAELIIRELGKLRAEAERSK